MLLNCVNFGQKDHIKMSFTYYIKLYEISFVLDWLAISCIEILDTKMLNISTNKSHFLCFIFLILQILVSVLFCINLTLLYTCIYFSYGLLVKKTIYIVHVYSLYSNIETASFLQFVVCSFSLLVCSLVWRSQFQEEFILLNTSIWEKFPILM